MLFAPSAIQLAHTIEDHEHKICVSLDEQHIHEKEVDCSLLHRQFQTLSVDFPSKLDVIPQHFYFTTFNEIFQLENVVYHSKKNPRGPPIIA